MKKDDAVLCETCFQKVESYIKFRSQLVILFERSNNIQVSDINLPSLKIMKVTENNASKTQISDTGLFIIIKIYTNIRIVEIIEFQNQKYSRR